MHSGPSEDTTFSSCSVVMCTVVVMESSGEEFKRRLPPVLLYRPHFTKRRNTAFMKLSENRLIFSFFDKKFQRVMNALCVVCCAAHLREEWR